MIYNDEIKRRVIDKFKEGIKNDMPEEETIKRIDIIPGDVSDKEQLFQDCKAYLFLSEVFENGHEELAIRLANKYLANNTNPSNVVKEKLATFYIKIEQKEKAKELLQELLQENPQNKWTICKYANILRLEGKYEEAIQFIRERKDIVKNDPVIFDVEFKILLAMNDIEGLIDLCEDVDELYLGKDLKERKNKINQLISYIITLNKNKSEDNMERIQETSALITKKVIKEKGITKQIAKRKRKKDLKRKVISQKTIQQEDDNLIIERINEIIESKKEETTPEELKQEVSKIDNEIVRIIMLCQIDNAYGKKGVDIAIGVKQFTRDRNDLDERALKTIKMLQNFLTSKSTNFYMHNRWTRFQEQYVKKMIEKTEETPSKKEKKEKDK